MSTELAYIGKRIREIRQSKDLSLEKTAKAGELDFTYLSHIENGRATPSLKMLIRIAKGLEIKPSLLIDGDDMDSKDLLFSELEALLSNKSEKDVRIALELLKLIFEKIENK